jgi:HSP20 family protein
MTDRTSFSPVVSLRQAMDELLSESSTGTPYRTLWSRGLSNGATVSPLPLDVYMTQDAVVVLAAAPGLQPDQFQITYNQGTLQLTGTIPNVADSGEAKGATWYVHELWSGTFQRAVSLPIDVDVDQAQASFAHGILKIVLPKAEQAKPKSIPITTNGHNQAISSGK